MSGHWCICGREDVDHSERCPCCGDYFWPALCCQDCPCGSYFTAHVTRAPEPARCKGSRHTSGGWWRQCRRRVRTLYGGHPLCKTHAWQAASLEPADD